jgi:two-component SAPR family response regulator
MIVEDELLVAMGLEDLLEEFGFEVVGPYPTVTAAREALQEGAVDGAVLDVNVCGELVFPFAETLRERQVPFVFCTGHAETGRFPATLAAAPRVAKPYTAEGLRSALNTVLAA